MSMSSGPSATAARTRWHSPRHPLDGFVWMLASFSTSLNFFATLCSISDSEIGGFCFPQSRSYASLLPVGNSAQGALSMEWVTPQHEEIDLNCEVSSYANAEL
jgi:hypothetical protein